MAAAAQLLSNNHQTILSSWTWSHKETDPFNLNLAETSPMELMVLTLKI